MVENINFGGDVGFEGRETGKENLEEKYPHQEGQRPENQERMKEIKAIVFGNSLFERNDQYQMIDDIAASLEDEFSSEMLVPDGSHLQWHGTDPGTYELIKDNPSDVMIMQEKGGDMARDGDYYEEYILKYAKRIGAAYRQENPNGRIILFQTWASKNGEADSRVPEEDNYSGMQNRINKAYEKMAQDPGVAAEIAPVGEAWSWVRENHPEIELYTNNMEDPYKEVHPSREGSYLSACVFYVTLFGKSVIEASDLGIDHSQASILREAADKFALKRKNQ
jgi:hypothetical protein